MHVAPVVEHIRFYGDNLSFENKDPYETIMTAVWVTDKIVCIQGLNGKFSRERYAATLNHYRTRGVHKVIFERDGEMKEEILNGTTNDIHSY